MSETDQHDGAVEEITELPPRDSLVRTSLPFEIVRSTPEGMPTLHGRGAVYGEWTEIGPSRYEGHFMERFAPGAFAKTIGEQRDRIRCLFNHGQDPSIGMKPLGPITDLSERGDGLHYEVELLDTDYCRSLVPGLEAGLYGSSFRFAAEQKTDERKRISNPKGLLERTIHAASLRELGPTPFPAYGGTTAAVRSLTDEFLLGRFPAEQLAAEAAARADRDLAEEMQELARMFVASDETDEDAVRGLMAALQEITGTSAHPEDAALTGTSRNGAATATSTGLYGLDRDEEEAWRL